MAFELDTRYRELIAEAAAVAERAAPFAAEADASSALHPAIFDALAQSDLWALVVPAAAGGRFERVDPLAVCVVRETLMATSSQLDSLFALQGIGSYPISAGGSDAQRAAWLPRVRSGDALAALALTEPEVGSDLRALATTAVERGGRLRVRGEKSFISNAGVAAFYCALARDGDGDGLSMLLVPGDAPGLRVLPAPELIAPHVLGDLALDVELEPSAWLGVRGGGLELVLATLAIFRVSVAGAAVGLAQAALDEATRHAASRGASAGRPLGKLGAVRALLADAWVDVEQARLLTYRAAERAREDPAGALHDSSMAKLAATEAAGRVVDRCVQVMGRFGLVRDAKIERLYRQARPMRIYEGASEVLRVGLARELQSRTVAGAPA